METIIRKDTILFLKDLMKNNNRDWFNANKERFIATNENFTSFVQSLIDEVAKFDQSVGGLDAKSSVFRIYRDTRFSKDKTPYKTHLAATLLGKGRGCGVAGYYLHLEPGKSFLAGGVHMTEPKNLKAIREEISSQGKELLKIISDKNFRQYFNIEGERLTKVPQGFDKDDPMAEYLKYKELMIHHAVADKDVLSTDFIHYCVKICKAMVPFNKFVNDPVLSLA